MFDLYCIAECQSSLAISLAGSFGCGIRMDGVDRHLYDLREVFCISDFKLWNDRNIPGITFLMNFTNLIILFGAIVNAFLEEKIYGKVVPKEHRFGKKVQRKIHERRQKQN